MYLNRRKLTGMRITDLASARAAMLRLHDMGAKTVVISSSDLGPPDVLVALASSVHSECFI